VRDFFEVTVLEESLGNQFFHFILTIEGSYFFLRWPHFLLDFISEFFIRFEEEQIERFIIDTAGNHIVKLNCLFLGDELVSFEIDSGNEVEEGLQCCWAFNCHPLVSTDQCTFDCE
jgi:hypothetical protein